MHHQGIYLTEAEITKIKDLLRTTDLSSRDIATRMDCDRDVVHRINVKFKIRDYRGQKRSWWINGEEHESF